MKCKFCGFDIEEKSGYCPHCGAKVEKEKEISSFRAEFADVKAPFEEERKEKFEIKKKEKTVEDNPFNEEKKRPLFKTIAVVVGCLIGVAAMVFVFYSAAKDRERLLREEEEGRVRRYQDINVIPTVTPADEITPIERITAKEKEFYVSEAGKLFYYEKYTTNQNGWWRFDEGRNIWVQSDEHEDYFNQYMFGLSSQNAIGGIDNLKAWLVRNGRISKDTDIAETPYDLFSMHIYMDAFPKTPEKGYYVTKNGDTYYYLSYGKGGIVMGEGVKYLGWYYYDVTNGWRYITNGRDKIDLGDELWYGYEECYAGLDYSAYKANGKSLVSDDVTWNAVRFATDFKATDQWDDLNWFAE